MKPWEETWDITQYGGLGSSEGQPHRWIAGFVQSSGTAIKPTEEDLARARLAAAAPDLVRVLLRMKSDMGGCSWCGQWSACLDDCQVDAALRKAGVR